MRHIHTSIVSRHLAIRGYNKILRTPPPHTSSSEERLPRRTLAQLITNKSPFLKSYLHKVDAKTHPSPLYPLCNIHTHNTHHLFNCTHIRTTLSPLIVTPGFLDRPHRGDCTAGQMDGEAGWWTTSGNIGLPPLARVMGVGRQQQVQCQSSRGLAWPVYPKKVNWVPIAGGAGGIDTLSTADCQNRCDRSTRLCCLEPHIVDLIENN